MGVQGGGCSGLSYFLSLDKEIRPQDKIPEHDGVKVVVDSKSAMYLEGTILDFTDGLMGRGFVFNNPNAVRTCGCGSSFSV
ncbi:MAG: iron-sulfur cluster assembly accessory protein [candidate division KSB1 bacterium]|nr:iron-sulfur cluster assembly accessory protein [candidate division KSB1 bacterium]